MPIEAQNKDLVENLTVAQTNLVASSYESCGSDRKGVVSACLSRCNLL